jgi:hypothetical protein
MSTVTYPPAAGYREVPEALREYRTIIEAAIASAPRSLQKRIGPSELGAPCQHCLAAKLAGWPRKEQGGSWLPAIGTAVHAYLEGIFTRQEADLMARAGTPGGGHRYRMEQKITVGTVGGVEITGSTDLLDEWSRCVVDWKIVGDTTLTKVKAKGPSEVYRRQANLYAKGWNDADVPIEYVAICFLPRNKPSLSQGIFWHEPHDRTLAVETLDRVDRLAQTLDILASISIEARDTHIRSLPRDPDCFDCARFADRPPTPHEQMFADLAGITK